ncbi:hypothetical protein N431DRAFT_158648 [Stipitochalara longipes BDJ]|nr:hypothetical protein N431DRAFT_158648 [Stipitochalara longipes BDJ]
MRPGAPPTAAYLFPKAYLLFPGCRALQINPLSKDQMTVRFPSSLQFVNSEHLPLLVPHLALHLSLTCPSLVPPSSFIPAASPLHPQLLLLRPRYCGTPATARLPATPVRQGHRPMTAVWTRDCAVPERDSSPSLCRRSWPAGLRFSTCRSRTAARCHAVSPQISLEDDGPCLFQRRSCKRNEANGRQRRQPYQLDPSPPGSRLYRAVLMPT